jgi:uncharacterized membrane protein YccC
MKSHYWKISSERFIHSIKTALAVLIGFVITKSIHFPVDQWLIITIIVVMCAQLNVGSMMQKSYMRLLGTLTGSLIAIIMLELFGTNPIAIATTISLAAFVFSYAATSQKNFNDAGTLGAATVTIILVGQNPSIIMAAGRFFEISIGIVIAALVSQFILPIHARTHLRKNQADTIRRLRAYYLAALLTDQADEKSESYFNLDESIVKSIITQRKLAVDAAREPLGKSFNPLLFSKYLSCMKEMLRSIDFMHHAYASAPDCKRLFSNAKMMTEFHDVVCEALEKIADQLEKNIIDADEIRFPSLNPIRETIQNASNLNEKDRVYADAFLFCAEIMVENMRKMVS